MPVIAADEAMAARHESPHGEHFKALGRRFSEHREAEVALVVEYLRGQGLEAAAVAVKAGFHRSK